jgi:hypothetical protein
MLSTSSLASSSWQAFRLTSKPPAELLQTLGPYGVDDMVRQMLAACWRDMPADDRTVPKVQQIAREIFDHHLKFWARMKKPSPGMFFANLPPAAVHGFARQAMVLCWMMLPRGHRSSSDVVKAVSHIFQRNLAAWNEDQDLFTKGMTGAKKKATKKRAKAKKPAKKKTKRK